MSAPPPAASPEQAVAWCRRVQRLVARLEVDVRLGRLDAAERLGACLALADAFLAVERIAPQDWKEEP